MLPADAGRAMKRQIARTPSRLTKRVLFFICSTPPVVSYRASQTRSDDRSTRKAKHSPCLRQNYHFCQDLEEFTSPPRSWSGRISDIYKTILSKSIVCTTHAARSSLY